MLVSVNVMCLFALLTINDASFFCCLGGDAVEEGFDHPFSDEEESTSDDDDDDEEEADIGEGSLNNVITKLTSAGMEAPKMHRIPQI